MKKGIKKETRHLVGSGNATITLCSRPVNKVLLWAKKGEPKAGDATVCKRCMDRKKRLDATEKKFPLGVKPTGKKAAKPKAGTPGLLSGDHWPEELKKETTGMVAEALEGTAKIVRSTGKRTPALAALGDRMPAEILGRYKGIDYVGTVTADGEIRVDLGDGQIGKAHRSPSGAAMAITGKPVDGWTFWKYRKEDGTLEAINFLRPTEDQFIPKPKQAAE